MGSNDYCKFREAEAFGNQVVLECCRNPYSIKEIIAHYKMMEAQKLFFPFSKLIFDIASKHKTEKGKRGKSKIIAIPVPYPDRYCKGCSFYE